MTARNRTLPVVVSIAAVLFFGGCGHDEPATNDVRLEPISVRTTEVNLVQEERPIEVRGIVQAAGQADVSSRVMGPVVTLKVKAGTTVAKGQTLLEIQPAVSQGQLSQAQGALGQATAALALAERNFERYQNLHEENAASELELDMARMQYEQARSAVEQTQGAVQSAATVAGESEVTAPFAGRVIQTLVDVGDLASPGRPLIRIESLEDKQIWLTVREADAGRVEIGDELHIRFDARPDLNSVVGVVDEIVPTADPATHTFIVKAGLGKIDLPSGFSGRAAISGDATDRLVVPISAVHRRGGLELVIVRAADGSARTRAVTTGAEVDGDRVEILSGLNAGESVVVNAAGPVADGTPLELER